MLLDSFFRILMVETATILPVLGLGSVPSLGISEMWTTQGYDRVWWVDTIRLIPHLMTIFANTARLVAVYADRKAYLVSKSRS